MSPLSTLLLFHYFTGLIGAQGELQKPEITVESSKISSEGRVLISCKTSSSVSVTSCNLYSGDTQQPHRSVKTRGKSCVFNESVSDLSSEVSCDYSVGTDPSTLSPRSDRYIIPGHSQRPGISVSHYEIPKESSVTVTCVAPESVRGISCELYRHTDPSVFRTLKVSGNECFFTVTGTELLQGLRQTGLYTAVDLSCEYRDPVSRSQRSDKTTVQVIGVPKPELRVSPAVVRETDSVELSCEGPQSVSVSHCSFYTEGARLTESHPACRRSFTGAQLATGGRRSAVRRVNVTCQYNVKTDYSESSSPHSDPATVTVMGDPPKPELRVSPAVVRETDSVELSCEVPQSVSVSHCSFYTEGARLTESHPACRRSFTGAQLATGGRRSAVRRVNVTCQYTVKTDYSESPSPHSDPATVTVMEDQSLMWKIGVTAGLFLLVGVMVIGLWFWCKRKNSRGRSASSEVPADCPYALVMTPGSSDNTAAQDVTYCTIPDRPSPAAHGPVQAGQDITYSTIPDRPSPAAHGPVQAGQDITYSTIPDLSSPAAHGPVQAGQDITYSTISDLPSSTS
ncbi:uncharacterized protein [Lepisosteus oculatus]|uniref:uncharacterized protein isoform X2 n=1 Tax=Lepisosteus oculatus TaxID=7918 RepID=UPI0035F52AA8